MDYKLKDIINDYNNCTKFDDCRDCKAYKIVEEIDMSYCDLLYIILKYYRLTGNEKER